MDTCGYLQVSVICGWSIILQVPDLLRQVTHGNLSAQIQIWISTSKIPAGWIQINLWVNSWWALDKWNGQIKHFSSTCRYFATINKTTGIHSTLLLLAEFTYNNTPSATTGISLFFANKGYHLNLTIHPKRDLALSHAKDVVVDLHELHKELNPQLQKLNSDIRDLQMPNEHRPWTSLLENKLLSKKSFSADEHGEKTPHGKHESKKHDQYPPTTSAMISSQWSHVWTRYQAVKLLTKLPKGSGIVQHLVKRAILGLQNTS